MNEQINCSNHVEDFPALCCDNDGNVWVAMLERPLPKHLINLYKIEKQELKQIYSFDLPETTAVLGAVVTLVNKSIFIAFPVEQRHKWRIAYAFIDKDSGTVPQIQYIDSSGTVNINPAVTAVGAQVCLVWEANGGKSRGIYNSWINRSGVGEIRRVSTEEANSYNPTVATMPNGSVLMVCDSLRDKSADIYGCWCHEGKWQEEKRITSDVRIERHPYLLVHNDQIWMTWQAQSYPKLNLNRLEEQRIVIARLDDNKLMAPLGLFEKVSLEEELIVCPRITFDKEDRLWLTARAISNKEKEQKSFKPYVWCYNGNQWSSPRLVVNQIGRNRPVCISFTEHEMITAAQVDDYPEAWDETRGVYRDWYSTVVVNLTPIADSPTTQEFELEPLMMPVSSFSLAEGINGSNLEMPRLQFKHEGKDLNLWWGTLHLHTDISVCQRTLNAPIQDLFASQRDIEKADFCGVTDHAYNIDNPQWAYIGSMVRCAHDPWKFITFLGEEWTSDNNPPEAPKEERGYGHHNLIFLDPYYNRFYDAYDGDINPAQLWRQLEGVEFLCIPHQLADMGSNIPKDWRFSSESLQPVAEIFQSRGSYEYLGCPRQAPKGAKFKGRYLQDAWAQGIIIGIIASPDHRGGIGKTGVWCENLTREEIFYAIRARHTFGTSGAKIGLFFSSGSAMMGDKVFRPQGAIPFNVKSVARNNIKELVIFRNNEIVYRSQPGTREVKVDWIDDNPLNLPLAWYYARIHCDDNELAWTSPIWFTG